MSTKTVAKIVDNTGNIITDQKDILKQYFLIFINQYMKVEMRY